ncbi:MAG: hypothetical protein FJ267_15615 [Planctomycetes bacterium]|nr:hypothetical protein [Planctomycetota bacterium]
MNGTGERMFDLFLHGDFASNDRDIVIALDRSLRRDPPHTGAPTLDRWVISVGFQRATYNPGSEADLDQLYAEVKTFLFSGAMAARKYCLLWDASTSQNGPIDSLIRKVLADHDFEVTVESNVPAYAHYEKWMNDRNANGNHSLIIAKIDRRP